MTREQELRFNGKDVGCYIDGSASSAEYLNKRTIKLAEEYGFTHEEEIESIDTDILSELSDDAVEWLNDNIVSDDVCFTFDDNSLFLVSIDETN